MTIRESPTPALYLLPLNKSGSTYTTVAADTSEAMIGYDELADVFESEYHCVTAVVNIDGILYETEVFVPKNDRDVAYVVVNHDREPIPRVPSDLPLPQLEQYLSTLESAVSETEAYPTLRGELVRTQFVTPHFVELMPGKSGARMPRTWAEVSKQTRAVILGAPGSGKTTCLRALAMESAIAARAKRAHRIPLYVSLR